MRPQGAKSRILREIFTQITVAAAENTALLGTVTLWLLG
jgi:hypothetical protein